MREFLDIIELFACASGLIVIWLAPIVAGPVPSNIWKIVAITTLLAGLTHGITVWLIRRRYARIRNEVITDIRLMLKDMINNQLTIIIMNSQMANALAESHTAQLQEIRDCAHKVSASLDELSYETLQQWKKKYEKNSKPSRL